MFGGSVRLRTARTCASPSLVGGVAPVQNLSFRVVGVGLSVPFKAELISTLYVDTPQAAVMFRSLSIVTVPPDSPLIVNVKKAALFEVEKEPAKPLP